MGTGPPRRLETKRFANGKIDSASITFGDNIVRKISDYRPVWGAPCPYVSH